MTPRQRALPSATALALLVLLAPGAALPAGGGEAPPVAVSIPPLHSLVAGVMAGVGAPALIQRSGSPHGYVMRPSDARALAEARVVFLVDLHLETFLVRPLAAHRGAMRIVAVGAAPGVKTLPARSGGIWNAGWSPRGHDRDREHRPGGLSTDWHLWLSPANARAIAAHAARVLAETDPANAPRYAANAAYVTARIDALEAELHARLAPVRGERYIVFHDAYRYFEEAFGLSPAGAVTVSPDRQPGIQRVRAIRRAIREAGARCVFAEPQFEPALVQTLVDDTGARAGTLDPLGAAVPPGPDAWFAVMRGLADSLLDCLGADG